MGAALKHAEGLIYNELDFLCRVEKGIRAALQKEAEQGVDIATEELQAALVYVEQAQFRIGDHLRAMG